MSYPAIRDQIKVIMDTVSGVENVYTDTPWAIVESTKREKFKSGTNETAWFINRTSIESQMAIYGNKQTAHIFTITGFMRIDSGNHSAHDFNDLIDLLIAAFDANQTLNATAEAIYPTWGSMAGIPGLQTVNIYDAIQPGLPLSHIVDMKLCAVEKLV